MLLILPPTLRRPPGRPTKVRRKEPDEPQTTERLSKRVVDMRCIKRHKVGVHNQVVALTQQQVTLNQQESIPTQQVALTQLQTAPTYQQAAPTYQKDIAPREKLSFKRKPTTVRWMPPTQESSMTD
ncbi:hypothetical protein GOBAR_AA10301 [Gossypium barbadense]|uniref:Uncharacterized protein n=1 Tax=Gossypium barbadense TaxID=3634 RepID=A0A2P5Y417_GOSBA|nr:hypothetical protein GOBAR_AA10301 [Gossypium barbadense]